MRLLGDRVVSVSEIDELPPFAASALVLVGLASHTESVETRWLGRRKRLVVFRVDMLEDLVHVAARQMGMDALLVAMRDLVDRAAAAHANRVTNPSATFASCRLQPEQRREPWT
jgi:hypothetical protein